LNYSSKIDNLGEEKYKKFYMICAEKWTRNTLL
jgi:hypothetical protein